MSIVAECPNCQSRVTLPDEAAGRKARCPNPGCRRVFVAEAVRAKKPARPPADDPVLPYIPPDPADAPEAEVVEEVAEAVEVAEPGPGAAREVVWSPDADLPGGPPRAPREGRRPSRSKAAREPEPEEDDEPITRIRRKKKKKNRSAVILIGMLSALALAIGAAVFFSVKRSEDTETAEAEKAKTAYDKQDYAQSGKLYGELATKYAEREKAEEYRFFADLSEVQKSVRSVSNRENPRPALEKLTGFVGGVGKKPLAKPDQFGHDIFDAGRKLAEDLSGYAKDRVETFGKDRTKTAELQQAEEVIAAGEKLLPTLEPFRPRSLAPADAVEKEFKAISATIAAERHRLAVVGRLKELLADPTDAAITAAKLEAAANGLARDAEVEGLIRGAEAGFLARVGYAPEAAERQQPAAAGTPSYIFVSPVGARGKDPAPAAGGPDGGAVFLAVARGLLYALDETGEQLWAVRVGPGVYYPPAVARAEGAEGPVELAVVAGDVAGQPAVSGYDIRTGQGKWRQPLPAAAAGPAAVIGNRAFLPLRDDRGTVVVLDLAAGTKLGVIRLGQPVGPVVARPGTSLLYVAGESRRVFVFDVDATDAQGSRPRCVRVLQTDHPAGTLRTAPVFLGPEGDDPSAAGKRWLLLSQSDGPAAMRLRAFPITTAPPAAAGAPLVPEVVKPEVDLAVPGWAWFPPAGDGERLAVLTDQPHPDTTRQDRGQLRLFGVNQPGSQDNPVYPLPSPTLPEPPEGTPLPGLVIPAEDAAFWVLANGTLQKYRLSILPDRGLVAAGSGPAYPIGVPTQPAQFTPRRDAACFVVRGGGGARAVLVGLADGGPRWQRQLGLVAAGPPARTDAGVLLVGVDGGAAAVPAAGLAAQPGVTKAAPEWVVATPADGATGRTEVAVSADGKTVFTVTPIRTAGLDQFVVRRLVGGKVEHSGTVNNVPGALAGPPAVVGGRLLIPAGDGFVYRHEPGDGRLRPDTLAQGPRWWDDRRYPDPAAHVVPVGGDAFVTSDGGKGLARWTWPAGGAFEPGPTWTVRERVATAPAVVPGASPDGKGARLLVADVTGGVWLFQADRAGNAPRRWLPGKTAGLPGGRPAGLVVGAGAGGRPVAVYAADGRRLVCLDPDKDAPAWVGPEADGGGPVVVGAVPAGDGRWLVTELGGKVRLVDGATGKDVVPAKEVGLSGAVPAAAGVPAGDGRVLVPLSDGSAAVVELPGLGGEPKGKE